MIYFSGPQLQNARNMATLKAISIRLKSVKNIQKITQSMKMVSAAKYAQADRMLKGARPYGAGASTFYERVRLIQIIIIDKILNSLFFRLRYHQRLMLKSLVN